GISLSQTLRKNFSGPVLLTAFEDDVLNHALGEEGFVYNDVMDWIMKPVRFEILAEKIELYLNKNRRIRKRFDVQADTVIVGKGAGRGKRSPKSPGRIVNLSIGGALVKAEEAIILDIGDDVTLVFDFDEAAYPSTPFHKPINPREIQHADHVVKIRSTIAWTNQSKDTAG
ncbi:MAG: hypothetical protein CUN57_01355, partial [Phototrophicales bacterium]